MEALKILISEVKIIILVHFLTYPPPNTYLNLYTMKKFTLVALVLGITMMGALSNETSGQNRRTENATNVAKTTSSSSRETKNNTGFQVEPTRQSGNTNTASTGSQQGYTRTTRNTGSTSTSTSRNTSASTANQTSRSSATTSGQVRDYRQNTNTQRTTTTTTNSTSTANKNSGYTRNDGVYTNRTISSGRTTTSNTRINNNTATNKNQPKINGNQPKNYGNQPKMENRPAAVQYHNTMPPHRGPEWERPYLAPKVKLAPAHHFGDHYFGYRLTTLPRGYETRYFDRVPYYYHNGIYYKAYWGGGYIVCRPPVGTYVTSTLLNVALTAAIINTTIDAITRISNAVKLSKIYSETNKYYTQREDAIYVNNVAGQNNQQYYYQDGVFYTLANGQYYVIEPPIGALVTELPADYTEVTLGNQTYYQVENALYQITVIDGALYFEVVCTL
jgi:hypothetical protein